MLSRNNKSFLPCSKFLIFGNRTLYVSTLLKICIIGQIPTTIRLLMLLQITIHVIIIARKGWVGAYYCTTFLSQRFIDLSIFRSNFQWMRINESTTTNQKKLIWRYSVTEPEMPFFHKKIYSKNRSVCMGVVCSYSSPPAMANILSILSSQILNLALHLIQSLENRTT